MLNTEWGRAEQGAPTPPWGTGGPWKGRGGQWFWGLPQVRRLLWIRFLPGFSLEASASSRTNKTNQNKKTKTKKSGEPKQAKPPLRRYYYCSCDHSTFPSPSLWLFCHVRCRTAHASACHTTSTGPHSKVCSVQVNDGPHLTSLREFQEGPGHHKPHPGFLPTRWFLFSPLKP